MKIYKYKITVFVKQHKAWRKNMVAERFPVIVKWIFWCQTA